MSSFIQITDTHIVRCGELAYGHSDTATALETAITTINERLPLLGKVNCAIVTGDLTEFGTIEEYERFKAIMSRLKLPYLAVPGNHDDRELMRAAFSNKSWMPQNGPIQWCKDFDDFTLIGLDTLLQGAHYGELSQDGYAFLDATLAERADRPIIIATHHPWMHSGIVAMDRDNLRNGAALMARLQAHNGPVRMISGHVHRALTAQIGKVTCQIAPAPCHAVHLDHRLTTTNDLILEPGAVTVHKWLEKPTPALVSGVMPIGHFAGPWPF